MGFCIINNTAIAAAKALTSVDRVAIVDWDVHHGNGTQDIFYGSDRVLYLLCPRGGFFPRLRCGNRYRDGRQDAR